ncbi:MAG: hypothetical protein WC769_13035 [Thermodesulfovibrionales bacterium]
MSNIGSICPHVKECPCNGCIGFDHIGCKHKPKIHSAFENTPTLLYMQEKETGIGKLYLNGKLVQGLQKISIEAETDSDFVSFPKLRIETTPQLFAKNFE